MWRKAMQEFWRFFCKFGRNERGVIAIIVALAFIPMVLATGAAVDFSRSFLVKARLGSALDAAGLAVGASDPNSADLQTVLQNFFNANFPTQTLVTPTGLSMTIEGGEIFLSASARVETTFLKIIGKNFSMLKLRRRSPERQLALRSCLCSITPARWRTMARYSP